MKSNESFMAGFRDAIEKASSEKKVNPTAVGAVAGATIGGASRVVRDLPRAALAGTLSRSYNPTTKVLGKFPYGQVASVLAKRGVKAAVGGALTGAAIGAIVKGRQKGK
jgi:hypothetical protein